jgi:hypothetical protein
MTEGLERLAQVELAEPAAEVDQVRRGDLLAAQEQDAVYVPQPADLGDRRVRQALAQVDAPRPPRRTRATAGGSAARLVFSLCMALPSNIEGIFDPYPLRSAISRCKPVAGP